jgi:putative glycerol-1-phosphate prenyltransferase
LTILENITKAKKSGRKYLAILIDPDDVVDLAKVSRLLINDPPDLILVGGSVIIGQNFDTVVSELKRIDIAPVVLFPGDWSQISKDADGILLLSLISGRNPEYLINQHVKASVALKKWGKEIIPTSYLLIDGGRETSVQKISETIPMSQDNVEEICQTALAGEQLGHKLIYLESGSGALKVVSTKIISEVRKMTTVPIIAGGGIRSVETAKKAWGSGATVVVIGTAFEEGNLHLKDFNDAKNDILIKNEG